MIELAISSMSALIALGSLWFTWHQWQRLNKKIVMIADSGVATEVLPAWYISRMMDDQWSFGLRTIDGYLVATKTITAISDDRQWMDVELLTRDEVSPSDGTRLLVAVADDRRAASIQIDKIVSAYDLVTS